MKLTLEMTKEFVKNKIDLINRPNYPFRSRYRHTLRVLMWVERLQKQLGGDLEVLRYSALLHDCDWNGTENHAITSYHTAKRFLDQFELEDDFKGKVLEGVRYHNEQGVEGLSKETYILMDADELDEVGAISIMWDILAAQYKSEEVSYKTVLDRIKKYSPDFKENISKFNFEYSKEIYKRKVEFRERFILEAEEELEIEL
jgi:uncharacterized protein